MNETLDVWTERLEAVRCQAKSDSPGRMMDVRALAVSPRVAWPGRVLDAKHCEATTNVRNHPIPKTPVTIEELDISPDQSLARYFPYKEEVGGSSPSTPTESAFDCWVFFSFRL